jgi:glucokinase
MNDFKAIALAIPHLKPEHLRQTGGVQNPQPEAPIGIIGPGTGLGVASLIWCGEAYAPVPGEGGHVTMAAKTRREFAVFETLYEKYHHISAERVCSGKGLVNIYNALRTLEQREDLPDLTPEQISAAAVRKSCPICAEALDLMIGFLGRVAGDLALTLGAGGGIYLAGGICTQLGEFFFTSRFREEFEAKGRFDALLKKIPTYLILHPFTAFIGLRSDVDRYL